jgi:hypothetical protein
MRPAIALLLVAPVLGEVLSTSTPPVLLLLPWNYALLAALYGCGALLCREVARRFRLGLPGLLLLAAAYGVYEEALVVGTWFDAGYQEAAGVGSYSRVGHTNVLLAAHLTTFHATVSVCASITVVGWMFPAYRRRPWVGRRGLAFAAVALLVVVPLGYGSAYRGPVGPMAVAGALCVLLVAGAFLTGHRARRPRRDPPPPGRPRLLTAVAFACAATHFVTVYAVASTDLPWPFGLLLAFVPVVVGVLVVGRRPQGIVGILAFFLVLDALVGLGGRYDLTVAAVLLAVALWWLRRRWKNAPVFPLDRPPATVGDLAAALRVPLADLMAGGLSGMGSVVTPAVSATYAWDLYHEPPVASVDDLARRRLVRYAVPFASGRSACEEALAAGYGPPVALAGRTRYGPFFLTDGEPFTLEWYDTTPDWARPPVDAAARIAAVGALAARVAAAASEPEVAAAVAGVPAALGVTVSDSGLRFEPPMPAADLVRAFGWTDTAAQTVDVHMSTWTVVHVSGDRTAWPTVGRWRVDAYLAGRPSGDPVPGVSAPAASIAHLDAADPVGSVRFGP